MQNKFTPDYILERLAIPSALLDNDVVRHLDGESTWCSIALVHAIIAAVPFFLFVLPTVVGEMEVCNERYADF